jgi:hypothetical protein
VNDPLTIQHDLRQMAEEFFAGSLAGEDVTAHALDLVAGSLDEYSKIVTYRLRDKSTWHAPDCPFWMVGITPTRWHVEGEGISGWYQCSNCHEVAPHIWWSRTVLPRYTDAYFFGNAE